MTNKDKIIERLEKVIDEQRKDISELKKERKKLNYAVERLEKEIEQIPKRMGKLNNSDETKPSSTSSVPSKQSNDASVNTTTPLNHKDNTDNEIKKYKIVFFWVQGSIPQELIDFIESCMKYLPAKIVGYKTNDLIYETEEYVTFTIECTAQDFLIYKRCVKVFMYNTLIHRKKGEYIGIYGQEYYD